MTHTLSSPLGRTRETTALINSILNLDIVFDERLMERDCGEWSGLTLEEAQLRDPEIWAERSRDPFQYRPPGGENLVEMMDRVGSLLRSLSTLGHEVILLVSHGVMSRAILTHFLKLVPEHANRVRQPNDLVYRLDFSNESVDCSHFRDGAGLLAGLFER